MIYIIEGADGTGKTTLANYLSKATGFPIKHRSNPKNEEERKEMYNSYLEDIKSSKNVIWDRSFYSEIVYGPIMRDQSYIDKAQMLEFELLLAKSGAVIIFCDTCVDTSWDNMQERGESYITEYLVHEAIVEKYRELMIEEVHLLPVLEYEINEYLYKGVEQLCVAHTAKDK